MSDDSATISFRSVDDMTAKMRAILEALGFTVTPPGAKWMKPVELGREYGVTTAAMTKALHDPCCPHCDKQTGQSGRINKISPNHELRKWLAARFTK
ncbi:hypothetical protein TSACC_3677 [Terrimicrobium sacchariphilum]|uniref:Uncharacterized protein n=1 Tax=Terrimicrobium sacchariphilum TaxID=690879 RepID=A0A146GGT3_TERSA|nr:hypothetical protein [Terrimicrobium sacchariphilum]GAT35606.1 hypothetical protein TSACC_3677 [Terrimicrobium sacchariphilum]